MFLYLSVKSSMKLNAKVLGNLAKQVYIRVKNPAGKNAGGILTILHEVHMRGPLGQNLFLNQALLPKHRRYNSLLSE